MKKIGRKMKLTKKEKSWSERYGTEVRKNMWERNKHLVFFEATSKEGIEQSEKYAEKHGRGWWIFSGVDIRHNREKKTWIEQFIKKRGDDASEE
jgi:hypothetical protein|tara:strand:- start:49 stop:330 length:282 start_codon:yes stop_codon:yes gene_type:complete